MFLKSICPFLGLAYLFTWVIQFFNENLFNSMNKFLGFLPNFINHYISYTTDIMGMDIKLGYIFASIFIIFLMYFIVKIDNFLNKIKIKLEKEIINKNIEKTKLIQKTEEIKQIQNYSHFFCLCEIKLKRGKQETKNDEELKKLKKEYTKMIIQKLKNSFPDMNYFGDEKIYLIGDNFSIVDNVISDIIKYFKIFQEIDSKKFITTDLSLAIVAGNQHNNPKMIYKFLLKINELKYLNKIIVDDKFQSRYSQIQDTIFEPVSLGLSHIDMNISDTIQIELFHLKRK